MTWILLNKRISLIIALFLCLLIAMGYANSLKEKLNKADAEKTKAVAAATRPYEIAAKQQQDKFNTASAAYEQLKSEQRAKNEVVIKEVQKIIDRPVYRNVCIDADGVSAINSLITKDTS